MGGAACTRDEAQVGKGGSLVLSFRQDIECRTNVSKLAKMAKMANMEGARGTGFFAVADSVCVAAPERCGKVEPERQRVASWTVASVPGRPERDMERQTTIQIPVIGAVLRALTFAHGVR